MRIAVCDDCQEDALSLKKFLGGHEVKVYSDAEELLIDIANKNMRYDLYLLDIYLGKSIDGIELAKELRKEQEEAVICFVSTSDDFYREAYDLYAVQYLLKPVKEETLRRLLDKVSKNLLRNREQKLSFQSRGQAGSIPYSKILYISSREHTLNIYCTDGTVKECQGRLNELAMQVCGSVFMRCHQSFLVNMYHVDNLKGAELIAAGHYIPVSRRYYADVKKRYQEILFEEVD
ncbi:LytTR family DNA-binding domain-containing protein [Lachnospiraceae bacterium 64-25]|nr:transcriptional regulatory protein BtsR [Lachnospiraceae bacterium]